MARAELLVLDDGIRAKPGRVIAHGLTIGRGDDHDLGGPCAARGGDDMAEDGKARDPVQDFGR